MGDSFDIPEKWEESAREPHIWEGVTQVRVVKVLVLMVLLMMLLMVIAAPNASAAPPGPGDKQCVPGQNNVGGGVGNSGPGDKKGAPLKPPPSCPGPDH